MTPLRTPTPPVESGKCSTEHFPTFDVAVRAWLASSETHWLNRPLIAFRLSAYALPVIGDIPIDKIRGEHLLDILRPIVDDGTDLAERLFMDIESVLEHAARQVAR